MARPSGARATNELPVRRVAFAFPDDLDPAWSPRFPEVASAANSVSLLMPFAEPYFVKSVRGTLPDLDDALRARTEDFLGQELQHHLQHRRFNQLVTRRYPGLVRLERVVRRTYAWLGRTRSVRFNVAFAAGSETIAYGMARWIDAHVDDLFTGADPIATTLFLWHLAEEVEHKTAAFDVFEEIDGSRLRYAWAMTLSLVLLALFTFTGSLIMLHGQHRLRYPVTWVRLTRWAVGLAFVLLPTLAVSALPGHHPSTFADPPFLPTWLRSFDPATGTMPLWEPSR